MRTALISITLLVALSVLAVWSLGRGAFGRHDSETLTPVSAVRSPESVAHAAKVQRAAADAAGAARDGSQILFGDLHAHTTISFDAFMLNMPLLGGAGSAPPADACDYARHCAELDFWSINDHAANITQKDWANTIESIRQCNERAGDPENPDLVSFLGWEWTQMGLTPETHYGHKNVVLRDTDKAGIPTRPIAASAGGVASNPPPTLARGLLALSDQRFRDLAARWTTLSEATVCDEGPVRELPPDCREIAATPADLFTKLDDWGFESIVIPPRHRLGGLHTGALDLGQAARRRSSRSQTPNPDRGLLGPRRFRGLPRLANRGSRQKRGAGLPGTAPQLPARVLARRRNHRTALPV